MTKRKHNVSPVEALRKLEASGLSQQTLAHSAVLDDIGSVTSRVDAVFRSLNSSDRNIGNMLFFVMYDIENNKVRRQVANYLLKMGCIRVQHSVYLADISLDKYHEIREDLAEVQAMYENSDSILICPVSTDLIRNMKIIGRNINIDLITRNGNTIFF